MRFTACLLSIAAAIPASAANVYVLSSGDAGTDAAVVGALTSRGHTCTVGVEHRGFDGSQSLAGFDTVYLQANHNWAVTAMPTPGQQALIAWVEGGGRLVTSEWTVYFTNVNGALALLGTILPGERTGGYGSTLSTTYDRATSDAVINAGVPDTIQFALTTYAGTEHYLHAKPGATVYYTSRGAAGAIGLVGWTRGSGSVFCISTTCGPAQLSDANFGRLFSNVMGATAPSCYANCDGSAGSPRLNVNDFVCFQSRFAAGAQYADCDLSGGLNVNDFVCFQGRFAAGCQ